MGPFIIEVLSEGGRAAAAAGSTGAIVAVALLHGLAQL